MIIKAGNRSTMSVFGTSHANVPAFAGAAGIIGAMVFAIYGFVGFENVVPLAEEAHDPRHKRYAGGDPLAVLPGPVHHLLPYAATVFLGVGRFASFPGFNNGNAWIALGKEVWHGGWYVLLFALLNSCVGGANGATNVANRHIYAMGRIRLLPSQFARVEEHHGTPITALVVLTGISVVVTLVAGLATGSPLEGFALLGIIETAIAILLYLLVPIACLAWFLRIARRTSTSCTYWFPSLPSSPRCRP